MDGTYPASLLRAVTGLNDRVLSHWFNQGYFEDIERVGSGVRRQYHIGHFVGLAVMASLRRLGVPLDIAGAIGREAMEVAMGEKPAYMLRLCTDADGWYIPELGDRNPVGIVIDLALQVDTVRSTLEALNGTEERLLA